MRYCARMKDAYTTLEVFTVPRKEVKRLKIPILGNLFRNNVQKQNLSDVESRFLALLNGYSKSKTGVDVNRDTACQISAVFACVNYKAATISSLDCILYKRTDKGELEADNLDLYHVLKYYPNPETTAAEFWEMYIWNLELTGYGFAYIKRDPSGFIKELWNVPTSNVKIYRNKTTNEKYYTITENGIESAAIYAENMMVTVGRRFQNKDVAMDPVYLAREAMGLGLALEEYASKYFANGASVSGVVEYPSVLRGESFDAFKKDFRTNFQKLQNAFNVMFLENGSKFQKISNNPEESQAIDARKFQVLEICRFFSVPPHKAMDLERATFSNIEEQNIDAVQTCLNPLCNKIELSIYKSLFTSKEKSKLSAKFKLNDLTKGDIKTRQAYYNSGIQNGYLSPNDVRRLENLNPYDGGDVYMVNGNMIPVNMLEEYLKTKGGGNSGSNKE